ncbi:LytTR family transcriptional regulator DNA-binding domain-containing protein [Bosea sp. (in: a-proteobacteria)]|uniref:LytTR family transcriptional regulator DNA-binding domain-containing protein n=1 Tax=Bosea sp. (in: a-proteobacteria) TaxID=1871050 RepID=UPI002DDCA2B5|nr:LytTR family transcriptional regulator DNA-binding domain-containing protein [Bosea sp. (in: a-proteobacteria)]HEV2508765.1 LytTR family transcriptional regulator DNA-binding domain-containing protein [Bosea sp. (in: a-proteobacteria)]
MLATSAADPVYEAYSLGECGEAAGPDWSYPTARRLLQERIDIAITSALAEIGVLAGADRAWMFEYDAELLRFRNTHEWSRQGVRSFVEDLQDTPVTMIAWLHQFLAKGRAVMINRVAELPRPARPLQVEMLRQGDKSVLSVPVFHDGRLRACIGFDATAAERRWSPAEIGALFRCAELISLARYGSSRDGQALADTARTFVPLIYLRRQGQVVGVDPQAILGVRSARDYAKIWLRDGSTVLDLRPLTLWAGLLSPVLFLRIHRTAIVNLQHVSGLDRRVGDRWTIGLGGLAEAWPVSRPYRQELRQRLGV